MARSTAVSVDEYLHTVYRPDCDYVDGEVIERNVGEFQHSMMQGILIGMLYEYDSVPSARLCPSTPNNLQRKPLRASLL